MTTTRRPRITLRRLAGAALATTAVAFGGVATLPAEVAQAAGVDGSRLQHVSAVTTETPTTQTAAPTTAAAPERTTIRVRVDPDGNVVD